MKHLLKLFINILRGRNFDILILTGLSKRDNFVSIPAKKYLYGNSDDFDQELKNIETPNNYSVYLDELLIGHPDEALLNLSPVENDTFYTKINIFLDKFEKKKNSKVIVALHPKRRSDQKYFNKKSFQHSTKELIKNCEHVIAHGSTSIKFAIIYEKPLILVSTNNISKYYENIVGVKLSDLSKELKCEIIDLEIDNYENKLLKNSKIDKFSYKNFYCKYIRHPLSKVKNTWSLIDVN